MLLRNELKLRNQPQSMNLPPLILASLSPRRAELLRELGTQFQIIPADAQEIQPEHLTPREICQVNAYRKARGIAKRHPDALIIAADTIVCLGAKVFGKPRDLDEAHATLAKLQGRNARSDDRSLPDLPSRASAKTLCRDNSRHLSASALGTNTALLVQS